MKRKKTKATEREGVNYVRGIVESQNSIYNEIREGNDIGADAFIEFIRGEDATGVCIAVQIKSGVSYVDGNRGFFFIPTDNAHLEYWRSYLLPVVGIVFDPASGEAIWIDMQRYIEEHANILGQNTHRIKIPNVPENVFSLETFDTFLEYFIEKQRTKKTLEHFGLSLEFFSDIEDVDKSVSAIKSLFYFHRNRRATWFYFINNFLVAEKEPINAALIYVLGFVPGHPDIWWHKGNIIDGEVRDYARGLISDKFSDAEVEVLLRSVDENFFSRGSIGQHIHAIIDLIPRKRNILKAIAYNEGLEDEVRYNAIVLLIYYIQEISPEEAIELVTCFLRDFPYFSYNDNLSEVITIIAEFGFVSLY